MHGTTPGQVEAIVAAAARAAAPWAARGRGERALALRAIADRLDGAAEELVAIAQRETHLAPRRLRSELVRTTFQLRLFAEVVTEGAYLDVRVDHADPDWPTGPRPDLRRTQIPLGPVVVFAASNFPFAFSVVGGDTVSALAAGCPVIVKTHPGHPDLSEATGRIAREALESAGAPESLLQSVHGREAGAAVLRHPRIKAGAFTGSIPGGRALFDIAASRPEPVPFYGELGSVNPVFVTARADADRGEDVAAGLVGSFTLGAGQFCTKPGVVLVPTGSKVLAHLRRAPLPGASPMLNDRIADGFQRGLAALSAHPEVEVAARSGDAASGAPGPTVLVTSADALLKDPGTLLAECFGPVVLVAEYTEEAQMADVASALEGQLTATLVADEHDDVLPRLIAVLGTRAGRLLWDQWPTGVTVSHAQHHGGPYPATTAAGTTSVGATAIARFLRPLAYQGFPPSLLPEELREDTDVPRRVDGGLIGHAR
ncbi:aldehyde dehydrogenase (NADP(+)) [Nocardiopsis sp. NPDC050513]|uniref:aldehyde dehydrogenase (NADP(+)) n=1 Tax=Nocardiopsis sp. NPDC050513 TaxID=3364338 RepID=UPI0037B0D6C6